MYLQKVEIHGFKSFASKTNLEFPAPKAGTRGIAAIVGPNGSGKSNVADAIRWVLGEQSMKLLRGKKSEDVIFAGSDKKTKLGQAEVSLHLNNDDRAAPVDYSEIVITRRVLRNGEGEYLLNRTPVRLHDILLLLAKANFGQRTYAIIGQGMVDEVLLQTPAARKEFFDEAAGVRAFQIKREQTVSKLDLTKENLQQADLLIQEISPRLRSLTRQVRRLEQREAVGKELLEAQRRYYGALLADVGRKLAEARSRRNAAEQEKSAARGRADELQAALDAWRGDDTHQDQFRSLQGEYGRLIEAKNAVLRERASLQGKLDSERTESGEANVVWLERKLEELDGDIERTSEDRRQAESRQVKLEARLRERIKASDAVAKEFSTIERQLRFTQERLTQHVMTLPELRQGVERAFAEQEKFLGRLQAAETLEDLTAVKAEAVKIGSLFAKFVSDVRRQVPDASPDAVAKLQEAVSRLLLEKDRNVQEIADLRSESRVFAERLASLARTFDDLREERESVGRELDVAKSKGSDQTSVLKAQLVELDRKLDEHEKNLGAVKAKVEKFHETTQAKQDDFLKKQAALAEAQDALRQAADRASDAAVEAARLETRNEDLEREILEEMPNELDALKTSSVYAEAKPDVEGLRHDIQRLKEKIEIIGGIDPQIGEEYRQTKERHDFLTSQRDDLRKAIGDLESGIESLDGTIKERFDDAFAKINDEFGKYFKVLFAGGRASLELVKEIVAVEGESNGEMPEEGQEDLMLSPKPRGPKVITGIDVHATPPGKRLKSIAMLSGGERALTSIALICAIIANNPSPFVVLDEVDAALDEANSIRFAQILEQLAQKTQFITITHNRATMERADVLYGVTMGDDGVSHLLSVKMEEAEKVISAHGNR